MKVLSLFSGIGAYEKALSNLGINFETVAYCELDPKTSACYELLHGQQCNLRDITKIDVESLPKVDLLVYSPPCQDISIAGQQAGISEHTRTGLMWQVINIIKHTDPKYMVMENVRTLVSRYKLNFDDYVRTIEELGYKCVYGVLNAKDYGLPQNRQRLFLICSKVSQPTLPKPIELKYTLKDYLDVGVVTINKDIAYTIRVGGRKSGVDNKHNWDGYLVNGKTHYLDGKECLRLMGFSDDDFEKLSEGGIAPSKIAKVAGNSVCVPILEAIFKELLSDEGRKDTEILP
jgi:site-specific DNA-cytosine methylase